MTAIDWLNMPYTILLADDNPVKSELIQTRLQRSQYNVVAANTGKQALALFAEHPIDLVVLDYYMPEMNGDVVALEMRKAKPDVPIIIFSGTFTLPEMVIAYVDGFVSCSDDPDTLFRKIADVLSRQEKHAS